MNDMAVPSVRSLLTPGNTEDRVAFVLSTVVDEVAEAIARELARRGAKVAVCGRRSSDSQGLVDGIRERGGEAVLIELGAPDAKGLRSCVDSVLERYGRIDILINNCADSAGGALSELTEAEFSAAVEATLGLEFSSLHQVVPAMKQRGYGRIVNVSSIGYLGLPKQIDVAAAQAGIFGVTRSVALEVARDNITVNNVVKGDIALGNAHPLSEEEKAKRASGIPVKRLGTPADVANAVCFFAAESTKYVTGQTLFVCGGKSAYFSMSV